MTKFNAHDHVGHALYGQETVEWAGAIYMVKPDEPTLGASYYTGNNRSDSEQVSVELHGCYDCDVEFEDDDT